MQTVAYVPYLYQSLMDHGKVSLHGLGTLLLDRTQAYFNADKTTLSPPRTSLKFVSDSSVDSNFSNILIQSGMERSTAESLQASLLQDLTAHTQEFKITPFSDIIDGELVISDPCRFDLYHGLTLVKSQILPHNVERHFVQQTKMAHEPTAIAHVPSYQGKDSGIWFPILIALFTLSLMSLWFFTNKLSSPATSPSQYASKPLKILSSAPNETDVFDKVDSIIRDNKSLISDKEIRPDSVVSSSLLPVVEKKSVKTTVSKTGLKHSEPLGYDISVNKSVSCVIIIGAFKNVSNAKKLITKIKKQGMITYTSEMNGLQRVGIQYDCKDMNPDSFKKEIKSKFDVEGWHLKGSL